MQSLIKSLENKNCIKIVCGAGNKNLDEIEKLVAVYAKAGVKFFDISADEDVIKAANKGLSRVISDSDLHNYHLCCSIGLKGDVHFRKAFINKEKCTGCNNCITACLQNAIVKSHEDLQVNKNNCIGCAKCLNICAGDAIDFEYYESSELAQVVKHNISCIELHATIDNSKKIINCWNYLSNNFDRFLSISLNRKYLSDTKLKELLNQVVLSRKPFSSIIQIDGKSMNSGAEDFKSSLQTIALADVVNEFNLPAYIMLSGGTNLKTAEFSIICKIDYHGIAFGSFARKLVYPFTSKSEFWVNKTLFNDAVKVAENFLKNYIIKN